MIRYDLDNGSALAITCGRAANKDNRTLFLVKQEEEFEIQVGKDIVNGNQGDYLAYYPDFQTLDIVKADSINDYLLLPQIFSDNE